MIAPALMGHVTIPDKWKSFYSIEVVLSTLQEEEKARREDKPSSSHIATFLGENPDEEAPGNDLSGPRKVHYHSNWNSTCKHHTSNDMFPRCKSVHKMAPGKSDDELLQHDNKLRIWTRSGKFRKVENPEWSMNR